MADFTSALWNKPTSGGIGEGGGGASDPVTRSLRFDGSAYLSRSTGSTSTTWTLSFWVKRATISGPSQAQYLATWGISGSAGEGLSIRGTTDSSNTDKLGFWNGSSTTYSTGVYRDPAGWANICISVNSGTATVYYNGESILSGITGVQAWGSMRLGAWLNQNELEGMIADVYGVEDSALDHTSFTESNNYGGLKPKAFTGVGSNGFHLLFENTSSIGEDDAGSNDFTASGLASADIREDNPLKNHATRNPLIKRSSTSNIFSYSEGKTVATYTGGVAHTSTTIASSEVHYAEFAFSGGTSSISGAGVVRARWNDGHADSYTKNYGGCYYGSSGNVDSPSGSTSVSAVGSDRLGIAFDGANNKADFYSVTSGGTMTLLKSLTSSDSIDFDGSATFTATSHDTGATSITGYFEAGEWWGTAPSVGSTTATALNTSNLGTPTVNPEEHFLPATYTGAGGSEEINLGFTPDLTWIKRRQDSGYYHGLYDSARGLSAGALASNATDSEDSTQRVASFDSDTGSEGFTLASTHYSYTNTSGKSFISWNWKESASAGFDIVTYEGDSDSTGDTQDISHSLGVAPEMIIVKARDGRAYNDYYHEDNWYVWHKDLSSDSLLFLNKSSSEMDYTSGSGYAPINTVGSSTFTVSNEEDYDSYANFLNWGDPYGYYTGDNERYVAYLFSGVNGHSQFGKFQGNSSSSGGFIHTSFAPSFLMVKRINTTGSWAVFDKERDSHNVADHPIYASSSDAEASFTGFDFLSNGIKWRSSSFNNTSGSTYIYAAFGSAPLRYSNS